MEYLLLIKEYRKKLGLTQEELAQKAKMNQSYLSQLERNLPHAKSPTLRMIFNIANALNVCPHILVKYERECNSDCVDRCMFINT
jgi:transcriptional regulator with XRE-family HTH domain